MTLSFYRKGDGGHIDYVFPLFPRKGLNNLLPAVKRREHYCAFALPEHGSITYHCNLEDSLNEQWVEDYDAFVAMLDNANNVRVKAYYQLLHTLKSFGSNYAFKNTDLATHTKVKEVFASFLYMSEWIILWGRDGLLRVSDNAGRRCEERIDAAKVRKEISCLRVEASFVLKVPNNRKEFDHKAVLASVERLLKRDLNVLFGYGQEVTNMLVRRINFMSVNDWLEQVRKVRAMLLSSEGEIDYSLRQGWRDITTRVKQQAQCLQSLLGYCCEKTNHAVRGKPWGIVWDANGEQEYEGTCVSATLEGGGDFGN